MVAWMRGEAARGRRGEEGGGEEAPGRSGPVCCDRRIDEFRYFNKFKNCILALITSCGCYRWLLSDLTR